MLRVINPRLDPETTVSGWLRHNASIAVAMALWAAALLLISWQAQPRSFDEDQWYVVSSLESATWPHPIPAKRHAIQAPSTTRPFACSDGT
jgi:hypothetical protein